MKTVEERIEAWIEGKLTGPELVELERELGPDRPATPAPTASPARQLGKLLRAHCSAPKLQNPDFFNHQLMQRIAADQAAAQRGKETDRASGRFLFFSLPRMALAGVFCLLMALLIFASTIPGSRRSNPTAGQFITEILNAHTEDPAISASAFHSKAENVTVLWLEGLNYLPDGEKL